MPRVKRVGRRRSHYTAQERHVLLSGLPTWHGATRFGPITRGQVDGVDVEAVRKAWELLGAELMEAWNGPEFADRRERYGKPWALRVLEGATCQG